MLVWKTHRFTFLIFSIILDVSTRLTQFLIFEQTQLSCFLHATTKRFGRFRSLKISLLTPVLCRLIATFPNPKISESGGLICYLHVVKNEHPLVKLAGSRACSRIMDFSEFRGSGHQKSQISQM